MVVGMISVIIPTYNRTRLLMERCIPSVLAQTAGEMEIHVIGDGTEEDTVREMEALKDPRIRFTNLPHQSYSTDARTRWGTVGLVSLNYGLDHAQGEWIAVIADDDEWVPEHNEILLRAAEESGADHVYGISMNPVTGQTWGIWPPGDGNLANGANLYKASLPYRYDMRCMDDRGLTGDADMWLRMVAGGVKFYFTPEVVHHYYPSGYRWEHYA
jgi:glycosyltransferase involved in cell wall biosynthesis